MKYYRFFAILITIILINIVFVEAFGQEVNGKPISEMTREDVLNIDYDKLIDMPLDQLMMLADIVGVSLEELYEMILNKDVVSASKKVESSFEAPLSTSVLSYNEIINSGVKTIEEALRLVPGMILREKTNGNYDVHIRGNDNLPPHHMFLYSENSISLVMIDGRPVYNYAHGGTFWETLPIGLSDVDRIEVVRGASSALYGPNAASGVVNIITKKPDSEKLAIDFNAQGGSQSTFITSLGAGQKINDKLAFRVTGNFASMNRITDELYVHAANNGNGGFISKENLATLRNPSDTSYLVFDPSDDVDEMFPNPKRSRMNYGANAYLYYDIDEDIQFALKGGYQYSDIISSTMGDNPMSHAGRLSSTGYVDFNGNVKGLRVQANYMGGMQDIVKQDTGFKIAPNIINASAEYDINLKGLNIRPGISYQNVAYDDMKYLKYDGQGFLNGKQTFSTIAASLRADYKLFDALRLIGAVRGEKYNTNDNPYISYQLIGSYNLNDKHNFRIVYSQANRSPFLVDTYADYLWERDGRPAPSYIHFEGKENMDLLTINMFEIGYRVKPIKSMQADIEFFQNKTKNYGALYPDSANLNFQPSGAEPFVHMSYDNIDMTSEQIGLTASLTWVVTKNIVWKVFGTYQKTTLYDVIPNTVDYMTETMLTQAFVSYSLGGPAYSLYTSDDLTAETRNVSTPISFGGASLDIKLLEEKLHIFSNVYAYQGNKLKSKYGERVVQGNVIWNARVSYGFAENRYNVYFNARNILGLFNERKEFAYMDPIGFMLLGGLNINL